MEIIWVLDDMVVLLNQSMSHALVCTIMKLLLMWENECSYYFRQLEFGFLLLIIKALKPTI